MCGVHFSFPFFEVCTPFLPVLSFPSSAAVQQHRAVRLVPQAVYLDELNPCYWHSNNHFLCWCSEHFVACIKNWLCCSCMHKNTKHHDSELVLVVTGNCAHFWTARIPDTGLVTSSSTLEAEETLGSNTVLCLVSAELSRASLKWLVGIVLEWWERFSHYGGGGLFEAVSTQMFL